MDSVTPAATVLVVDDSPMNIEFMRKHLGSMGYVITAAYRGMEAIKKAQDAPPDVVLLDVVMPDLTGFEVCRLLKMHPETADIPVIFVTAKGEVYDRVEGLEVGAHDFISKPFHLEELKARVKAAVRLKAQQDKLKKQAEKVSEASMIDALTGLYNKRYAMDRIKEEGSRAARYHYALACIMVDPDHFRDVNAAIGEEAADGVLRQFSAVFKKAIRGIDICARYGGEEFLVVLPQTSLAGARVCAEKVRKQVEAHTFDGPQGPVKVTVSCGVAECEPHDLEEAEDLLRRAHIALLMAKRNGRNQVAAYE